MLRFFLVFALSVNVASAQESASQPSSMPTSAPTSSPVFCGECLSAQPFSLSPKLSLGLSARIAPEAPYLSPKDKKLSRRLSVVAKNLALTSGASIGMFGMLTLMSEDDPFLGPYLGFLMSTGVAAAAGLNMAAGLHAANRYVENGRPRKLLRRPALYFATASAIQVSAIAIIAELTANEEGTLDVTNSNSFVLVSLLSGALTSIGISAGFVMKEVQDRRATVLAKKEEEPKESRSFAPGVLFGKEINRSSAVLTKAAIGLTALSVAMMPMQNELRADVNPASVLYVTTSGAALTASTTALFSYGLYRHQQTKKLLPLYTTAGLLAVQSTLRGFTAEGFARLRSYDEALGPSENALSSGSLAYGAILSGVSAFVMLGTARIEGTRALTQKKRL